MSIFYRSVLTIFTVLVFVSSSAQAEIYVWQDRDARMSLSYPDSWRMVHNQKPDDVLTIMGPSKNAQEDFASCRMRANDDDRFQIYPQRYSAALRNKNYGAAFWQSYVGQFASGTVDRASDAGGLGRGFGSYAYMTYVSDAMPLMPRRAVAFVSLYNNRAYVIECSAKAAAFDAWENTFLSIVKSVSFAKESYEVPGGYYRQLYPIELIKINGARDIDVRYY